MATTKRKTSAKRKQSGPRKFAPRLTQRLPSEWLRVALADIAKCRKDDKTYRIDMDEWHTPNSHCAVCLAGSVLAQTCKLPPTEEVSLGLGRTGRRELAPGLRSLLSAINYARVGDLFINALAAFADSAYVPTATRTRIKRLMAAEVLADAYVGDVYDVTPHDASEWREFYAGIKQIISILEDLGL